MFSSLRTRLTLSHFAVIVLAMGLSAFLLLSFLERYFLEAAKESLLAQARITAQALIPGAVAGESLDQSSGESVELAAAFNAVQQQQLSNLALQTGNLGPSVPLLSLDEADLSYLADASLQLSTLLTTRIRILDDQGRVLVDSRQGAPEPADTALAGDPLMARASREEYASRTEKTSNGNVMHLVLPVKMDNRLVGAVYLSQPLADVTQVLGDLRLRLFISAIIALLLSAVVGLLLSRAIASPLRRLTEAAGAVAQGQFDQHVPVNSRDEVGRLSRAFNEMTARLRAAHQIQVDFVADVSHELRTPLTAVKGTIETLRDGAVDDFEVRDRFLETVETETDRLIRLVNDLLILSRADSDALDLQREFVNLASLVETVVDHLTPQAKAQGVDLRVQVRSDAPQAWADPDRTEQVLVNLLDNAVKYSRPHETVTVSVEPAQDGSVMILVRDEGIGISAHDLTRVGRRFYRTDMARSRADGGSGLGLAIARALVEAHGGRLWLESQEGTGTTAIFTLPTL